MDSNRKRIIFDGATTLLLVVAATATLVCCVGPDLTLDLRSSDFSIKWSVCELMVDSDLPPGDDYPENNEDMLERIKEEIRMEGRNYDLIYNENFRVKANSRYIKRILVNFGTLNRNRPCRRLQMREYLTITTMCEDERKFKRYADFLNHYAPIKYRPCALGLIRNFGKQVVRRKEMSMLDAMLRGLNMYFAVALRIKASKSKQEKLYERLREVDIIKTQFNVHDMLTLVEKHLISWPPRQSLGGLVVNEDANEKCRPCMSMGCSSTGIGYGVSKSNEEKVQIILSFLTECSPIFTKMTSNQAHIINMARAVGAIKDGELTLKFLLINEYLNIFSQMEDARILESMRANFMNLVRRGPLRPSAR